MVVAYQINNAAMVVDWIAYLRRLIKEGMALTVHFTFDQESGQERVKFIVKAGSPTGTKSPLCIARALDILANAALNRTVVDQGQKHSDGHSEICFKISSTGSGKHNSSGSDHNERRDEDEGIKHVPIFSPRGHDYDDDDNENFRSECVLRHPSSTAGASEQWKESSEESCIDSLIFRTEVAQVRATLGTENVGDDIFDLQMSPAAQPASKALLEFLKEIELDRFAQDIVDGLGIWDLQDLLETVSQEDDLSDLKDTCMKKLQIRKLFNKLVAKKTAECTGLQVRGEPTRPDDIHTAPTLHSCELQKSKDYSDFLKRPSSLFASRHARSASSASTRGSANQQSGGIFERFVRGLLRKCREPGIREDEDFRDMVGVETDCIERLCQPLHSGMLLPSSFVPSCDKMLEPGLVIYEMKLSMGETQIGHAVGQLYARRKKCLQEAPKEGPIHLVVVSSFDSARQPPEALDGFSRKYPGILFLVTQFCPWNKVCSRPDEGDASMRGRSRTTSSSRTSSVYATGRKGRDPSDSWAPNLPALQQTESSDETDEGSKVQPAAARDTPASHEDALRTTVSNSQTNALQPAHRNAENFTPSPQTGPAPAPAPAPARAPAPAPAPAPALALASVPATAPAPAPEPAAPAPPPSRPHQFGSRRRHSRPRLQGDWQHDGTDGNIFLGNLSSELTGADVLRACEEFGRVVSHTIKRSDRHCSTKYALVLYENLGEAENAIIQLRERGWNASSAHRPPFGRRLVVPEAPSSPQRPIWRPVVPEALNSLQRPIWRQVVQ